MSGDIQVRNVTSLSSLREIEGEWFQLWERCESLSVFQSPDWVIPWVEAFSPNRLWVIEARCDNRLVGLAPLFIYGTGGDRIVAPLGAGVSDYLDFLVDRTIPGVLERLLEFIQAHTAQWTRVDLPDLERSSLLLGENVAGQEASVFRKSLTGAIVQLMPGEICPRLSLPASVDELRSVVPPKQMRNLRVARRLLDEAEVELANSANMDEFLTTLFELHEKRWQRSGKPGVLADPRVRELHRRAAPRLLARGMLRVFGLRHCGRLIACLMAFFERDAARLYMQGYDPEWASYSPGAQLIGAALEQAIREKKRVADFMRGSERYKYYWGGQDVLTYRLQIVAEQIPTTIAEKSVA